jgi:hypothetical protein
MLLKISVTVWWAHSGIDMILVQDEVGCKVFHVFKSAGKEQYWVMSLWVNAKGYSDHSKIHLVSVISNGKFESFLWKGSRFTVCHSGSAEVGLLPTATDLVSLITVQRWKLLILKDYMLRLVNFLAEGLIIILDSSSYNFTSCTRRDSK